MAIQTQAPKTSKAGVSKATDFNAVKEFITHNFRHFNSAVVIDAAEGVKRPGSF